MSKDHMIFLAGRKEYNGSLSNGSRWQPNSNQSDVTSLSDVNVSDDFLERYMNSSASVDESMSVQSYESGTSDMSEVTLRRSRLISSTSTPTKRSDYDVDSITGEGIGGGRGSIRGSPSGHQLVTNTQQSENHSNSVKEVGGIRKRGWVESERERVGGWSQRERGWVGGVREREGGWVESERERERGWVESEREGGRDGERGKEKVREEKEDELKGENMLLYFLLSRKALDTLLLQNYY